MRKCAKCDLPATSTSYCLEHGREYHRDYVARNKAKVDARRAKYALDHPEKMAHFRQTARNKIYLNWARGTIRAHARKYTVDIDAFALEALAKVTKYCHMCDRELAWGFNGKMRNDSPTLDRVENGSHMSLGNTQIICCRCNATKGPRSMTEFVNFCETIVNKFRT